MGVYNMVNFGVGDEGALSNSTKLRHSAWITLDPHGMRPTCAASLHDCARL